MHAARATPHAAGRGGGHACERRGASCGCSAAGCSPGHHICCCQHTASATAASQPGASLAAPHPALDPPRPYILIGSRHSLYTAKLRAYLQYRRLPFVELTACAELYRSVILPRTGEGASRRVHACAAGWGVGLAALARCHLLTSCALTPPPMRVPTQVPRSYPCWCCQMGPPCCRTATPSSPTWSCSWRHDAAAAAAAVQQHACRSSPAAAQPMSAPLLPAAPAAAPAPAPPAPAPAAPPAARAVCLRASCWSCMLTSGCCCRRCTTAGASRSSASAWPTSLAGA
jgi:hypothetical protein